jgi:hypothetical protein
VSSRPARRLVAVAVAAATLPLVSCDDGRTADLDGGPGPVEATTDRDAGAADALARLERALRRGEVRAAAEVAAPDQRASRLEMRRLVRNADRLDLGEGLALRHLSDSATALTARQRDRWGDEAWVADVQVTWRYGGVDRELSVLTVPVAFTRDDEDVRVLSADLPQADRAPVWLVGPVQVARGRDAVAVTSGDHSAREFLRLAETAAATVRHTLPEWDGVLCVEVPADQTSFRDAAGVPEQQASAIAAVTTTPDGTSVRGAPQHVYINPRLFRPLRQEGRDIVLAHEAAHVALGAALLDLPMWLSEGVADHVALARSTTPVETLAAQILRVTRQDGAPRQLPGKPEFDGSDRRIGAWYEAAWLAVELIADTYGEDALWRFYRRSVRDAGTTGAFRDVLGTTQREFVGAWRAHLTALAG